MSFNTNIRAVFSEWFKEDGLYVLVDGQYGSTGKGLIAGAIAEICWPRIDVTMTNNGPNSGHTAWYGDKKIVMKQLPVSAVVSKLAFYDYLKDTGLAQDEAGMEPPSAYLSPGAIVDPTILYKEIDTWNIPVKVSPKAAVVDDDCIEIDKTTVGRIASTGQGTGPALIRKVSRLPEGVWSTERPMCVEESYQSEWRRLDRKRIFYEVPQGYSLGINSGMYPYTTSRECTVAQAIADIGAPPGAVKKVVMSVRTYPIRVGNVEDASSGPHYWDQEEISWDDLGVEPEKTTVTNRERRVFTWSAAQFQDAVAANRPDIVFVNFCNYLNPEHVEQFVTNRVVIPYVAEIGHYPEAILCGFGPRTSDIRVWTNDVEQMTAAHAQGGQRSL